MRSRNETMARLRAQEDDLHTQNEELEIARLKLLEQDRLASLGLLSASVAHELNTPLAVLIGSIEKLAEEAQTPQAQARFARMLKMAQRLLKISASLIGFSRVRKEEMEPVYIQALIEEAWQIASIDERSRRLHFENLCDPMHAVVGNADRLLQVFLGPDLRDVEVVQDFLGSVVGALEYAVDAVFDDARRADDHRRGPAGDACGAGRAQETRGTCRK